MWTRNEAIDLCVNIEAIAKNCSAHIGLTGGLLYKKGERKDMDVVVYSIRQDAGVQRDVFFKKLALLYDIVVTGDYGFCVKTKTKDGRVIDFLFPEHQDGIYVSQ